MPKNTASKTPTNNKQAARKAKQPFSIMRTHRWVAVVGFLLVMIALSFGGYKIYQYKQQFSQNDFERLSGTAREVLLAASRVQPTEHKACHYAATGVYENPRLFCSIEMISYLEYKNDKHAVIVAKSFDAEIARRFPERIGSLSGFYSSPFNGTADTSITVRPPYPYKQQCTFRIEANERAKDAVSFLPDKTNNNLLALSFYCSAIPRAQYYPIQQD